jgi:hypothetical protein
MEGDAALLEVNLCQPLSPGWGWTLHPLHSSGCRKKHVLKAKEVTAHYEKSRSRSAEVESHQHTKSWSQREVSASN